MTSTVREVSLAFNWTKTRVQSCLDNAQREELVRFMSERYNERFFGPIHSLRQASGNHRGFGFAVMSLCSLLVETIQCYREGFPSSDEGELKELSKMPENAAAPATFRLSAPFKAGSRVIFKSFFSCPEHQRFLPGVDGEIFFKKIRCGLLHQAQTKDGWRVTRTGSFWDSGNSSINRDEFSMRLEQCFNGYLEDLSAESNWLSPIWTAAAKKIWWLLRVS